MRRKLRGFIAVLCCLCMVIGIGAPMADTQKNVITAQAFEGQQEVKEEAPILYNNNGAGDGTGVSRVEWLHELTDLFDMTVEEKNYPDNYYSDIDSSSEYYYDVMLATEFGMVEIETGEQFLPDAPATREFAAHTLNFCLGYVLEEQNYTFSEASAVTYADDIQVAVNQGWFTLTNGAFLPNQGITVEEKDALLQIASAAIAETEVNPEEPGNHVGPTRKSRGAHPEITWVPPGNHVGPTRKSRGPHPEITWAPRGNLVGPQGK